MLGIFNFKSIFLIPVLLIGLFIFFSSSQYKKGYKAGYNACVSKTKESNRSNKELTILKEISEQLDEKNDDSVAAAHKFSQLQQSFKTYELRIQKALRLWDNNIVNDSFFQLHNEFAKTNTIDKLLYDGRNDGKNSKRLP